MKLVQHEEGLASPVVAFMAPKMDQALNSLHSLTGLQLPLERGQYPNLVFLAGCMELLGGILFTLNVQLGAIILVSCLSGDGACVPASCTIGQLFLAAGCHRHRDSVRLSAGAAWQQHPVLLMLGA